MNELVKIAKHIYAGEYQLLAGAGISLDSVNINGENLLSGRELEGLIKNVKGVDGDYRLNDLYELLDEREVELFLTKGFTVYEPGKTTMKILNLPWRRIWTLNIDDALERGCDAAGIDYKSINFNDIYSDVLPGELQIVHLHGFVGRSGDGYVFSLGEYSRILHTPRPWFEILAESISTEPFIICGTNFNEFDIEYYLGFMKDSIRPEAIPPSVYVNPNIGIVEKKSFKKKWGQYRTKVHL